MLKLQHVINLYCMRGVPCRLGGIMDNVIILTLDSWVNAVNDVLWGYVLIYGLVGIGVFFTIYLGAPQLIHFGDAVKQVFGLLHKEDKVAATKKDEQSISSFQALAVAISAQVGTGNVAGVATAIMAGGPGAIFWMWMTALFGMSTIFSEAILAQIYRVKKNGHYVGGPAYYISKGLKKKFGAPFANFLANFFAFALIIAVGFIGPMVQSNSIASAIENAFDVTPAVTGIALAIVAGMIFIGGIQRIANFSQLVVPIMAVAYILCAIYILFAFSEHIIPTIQHIVVGAFNPQAVGGGLAGITMREAVRFGVARGLFSNEAGMGTTPHAHATAVVSHPVLQGFSAFIGVFFDTIVVCTATALIIFLTGADELGLAGALVTQEAFQIAFGSVGPKLIAVCLTFFAFTTIVGWYYFGESTMRYLTNSKAILTAFRIIVLICIVLGTLGKVNFIWNVSDMFNGIMVIPNLLALFLLRKEIKDLLKDYNEKRKHGTPVFEYPEHND